MPLILRDDSWFYDIPWWERGDLPAIPAPPGFVTNFVNPPSQQSYDIVTQTICLTITTIVVAIRLYTKFRVLKNPGWDDCEPWRFSHPVLLAKNVSIDLSLFAWLGLVALGVLCLEEDRQGNGRHLWDMTGYNYSAYAKLNYVINIIYNPTIFFTKASILMLYLRVFKPIKRTIIALHIVLWANFTFYFAATFVESFQCMPIEKAWYPLLEGHCFDQLAGQTASAAINTFSDFVILLVPIANVWGLQLYTKGRIGLLLIFGFGIFGCVLSIARLAEFAKKRALIEGALDVTWDYYSTSLLSVAEVSCGIICGCLPAFPAFIRHISGINFWMIIPSNIRSRDTANSTGPSSRQPIPMGLIKTGQSSVSSPSSAGLKKPTSIYDNGSSFGTKSPFSPKQHPWEELDELDYVRGDDKRLVTSESTGQHSPV